jgi:methylglyoxal/glyoxal reductase
MHCETVEDPEGTWRESWLALEKAYSEGLVNTIGVSNFNRDLLTELEQIATVLPHIVQNFADPSQMDYDVRDWCIERNIIYQPYASGRNLADLPAETKGTLERVASEHGKSEYITALRFMLQSGAVAMPRSSKYQHLKDNIEVLNFRLSEDQMFDLGWGEVEPEL